MWPDLWGLIKIPVVEPPNDLGIQDSDDIISGGVVTDAEAVPLKQTEGHTGGEPVEPVLVAVQPEKQETQDYS